MKLSRFQKQVIVLFNDILISIFSTWVALFLRLKEFYLPNSFYWHENIIYAFLIPLICFIPIFIYTGIYSVLVRFSGLSTLRDILVSSFIYGLIFLFFLLIVQIDGIPRSIGIVQPILFTLIILMSRIIAVQIIQEFSNSTKLKKALIYGAGNSGIETANAISTIENYEVIGFVDNDKSKIGKKINGIIIISENDIYEFIKTKEITNIFVALPNISLLSRKDLVSKLSNLNINIKFLPSLEHLLDNKISVTDFENVNLDDLLDRKIEINTIAINDDLKDKVILVTGSGGSIGSELSKQILLNLPKKIIILDHSEFNLYFIHENLNQLKIENKINTEIIPALLSIQDKLNLENLFIKYDINHIYHAAAYKHVPLLEENIIEAIKNNIIGTNNLIRLTNKYEVSKFILVSTDKAVRPTNIMGATKRFSEMLVQASADDNKSTNKTTFAIVRFGNVVNSSGSVIPLFSKQIKEGGPITVTHPDVTRYFMTIPEAASLILQSSILSEKGEVFVLNMGKPKKILDIARKMIKLFGLEEKNNEEGDIEIIFTGLGPGEKLFEELFIDNKNLEKIHNDIFIANEQFLKLDVINDLIEEISELTLKNDFQGIKKLLPEIKHLNFKSIEKTKF